MQENGLDFEKITAIFLQHKQKIYVGLAAAGLILASGFAWQWQRQHARQQAAAQLNRANTAEAFMSIARSYPSTEAADLAKLMAADRYFQEGKLDEAERAYNEFIVARPTHPLTPMALFGLAATLESQSKFAAAKARYEALVRQHPASFLTTAARLGAARCAEAIGSVAEAAQRYEEIVATAGPGAWQNEASLRLAMQSRQNLPVSGIEPAPAPDFGLGQEGFLEPSPLTPPPR
jgi:TolA-binding protein